MSENIEKLKKELETLKCKKCKKSVSVYIWCYGQKIMVVCPECSHGIILEDEKIKEIG